MNPAGFTSKTTGWRIRPALAPVPLLALLVALVAACEETKVVEVERPVFRDPVDTQHNFLGYFEETLKLTSCGNCHVGKQSGWEATGHPDAWQTLQASGAAQEFCEGCHTISERGNALTDPAGYNLVKTEQYEDVQCESCHGPGFDHVQNPDAAVKPLAPLSVALDLSTGCGECHSGTHHPFVEQWATSRHGTVPAQFIAVGREFCEPCHEGKSALVNKFNENDDYIEKDDGNPMAITCGVCHDPHGSPNDANLRAPIDVATSDHLCVTCHARRGTPPSSHGPHAAQGLLVLGENIGWIPPGFVYDTARIISTHGTTANPKLCATCHVPKFTVVDAETGEFQLSSVGHTFEATVCLDPSGLPVEGPCPVSERDFASGCTGSGCHGTDVAARSAFITVKARIERLLDDLWDDLDSDSVIDAPPTDAGLLPQVVAQGDTSQIDVTDDVVTVAEGALWNAMLAHTAGRPHFGDGFAFGIHFSSQKVSGEGVHNPFFLEAVLIASIDAVAAEYGLAPPVRLEPQLTQPPGWVKLR